MSKNASWRVVREQRIRAEKPNPAVLDMVDMILSKAGGGASIVALMNEVGESLGDPGFADAVCAELALVHARWRNLREYGPRDNALLGKTAH